MTQALRNETRSSGADATLSDSLVALGRAARAAARAVALASTDAKNRALRAAAGEIRRQSGAILAANALDVADAEARGTAASFLDRLTLDPARVEAIARGLEEIADLPDPVGRVLARFERPNGLKIERVSTPLGVIGVIYESRPNVTADAGGLCLKAGNAAILRGGSESLRSSAAIHACLVAGLKAAGIPEAAISLVATADRAAVGAMLAGLDGNIDVIVPRGGKSLVARVQHEARVPVFAHLEGIVHVFVHRDADLEMAKRVLLNAKMRRTGICGAAETLLVDRACAATHLAAAGRDADRFGLRSARRRSDASRRRAGEASRAKRTGAPNISTRSSPLGSSTGWRARSITSRLTARITRIASSPVTRMLRRAS